MAEVAEGVGHVCGHCGETVQAKSARLPRGWKRVQDALWCKRCWGAHWVVRTVTIPVAGPVRPGTWEEFRVPLRAAFQDTTRLSNWAVRQLCQEEPPRTATQSRIPKSPNPYLYPGARELVPDLDTGTVTAVLHAVEGRYRARRLRCYWQCAEAPPSYRYPAPLPIRGQSWSPVELEEERPGVSVRLGGRRWTLRLRSGKQFTRQLGDFRRLLRGEAIQGDLALIERRSGGGDHRSGGSRGAGGGRSRLMCKMVGWFPRSERSLDPNRTLKVRTSDDAAVVWSVDGESHPYHADHVRRWLVSHALRRQRWAEDLQRQHRWPAEVRRRMVDDHQAALRKHHRRMDSWVKETCAMLAGVAVSRRCGVLVYDDGERSYADLPWHAIRTRLEQLCHDRGVELRVESSGEAVSPEQGALDSGQPEDGQ